MRDELEPVAGNWYTHRDKGQTFQVVAVDEDRDVIEIQYFDGDLEQIDTDAWYDMDLEIAEPPEDERGPLDDDRTDDGRYSETAMSDRDYREELETNRPESEEWEDEEEEDEEEDEDQDEDEEDERRERGSSDERYEE
jgi:hypothetical protein